MRKSVSLLLLTAMLCAALAGCAESDGGGGKLRFKEVAGGVALYRYKGSSKETAFTVPDEHNGLPVVEIMDFALANAEYLTSVAIGRNIKIIGDWAFTNSLKLTAFEVPPENSAFTQRGGILYTKDMSELVACPNGKTPLTLDDGKKVTGGAEVIVPATVKKIRNNAFYICENLYTIKFNDGLEAIGDKAFIKCVNLQNFTLPGTLKTIGVDAFSYCDSLTKLTIPASVTAIGDYAFFSLASGITEIVIERENADGLKLGKDWVPNKKDTIENKVEVKFLTPEYKA